MATFFAGIFALFVVASPLFRVESIPIGCTKMIGGSPKDDNSEGYFVKVYPNVRTDAIVKIMLELTTSACEGQRWRSSNISDALFMPMTCSGMFFMEGFGFFAKMSDAAVMWVCENDKVDYLEPNRQITISPVVTDEPDPATTDGPATDSGSGSSVTVTPTSSIVMPDVEDDSSSGSGMITVVPATAAPSTCSKLRGELLPVNNYLVMLNYNSLNLNMDKAYELMENVKKVDPNFDTSKIKPLVQGSKRGFYYNGLSKDVVMKLCESELVQSLEVLKDTSTTVTPQPTSTPTPFTPSAKCDKIKEYKDERETIDYRYIVIMYKNTSSSYMQLFVKDLMVQSSNPGSTMRVKNIQPLLSLKMLTAEMNKKAMEYVCGNPKVKLIEQDAIIHPPPKPETSTPTTTIPTATSSTAAPNTTTTPATTTTTTTTAPSTTTNAATTSTTTPSTVTETSTKSTLKCSKLRGGEVSPQGLNLCRIYLKKDKTKSDCRRFVRKMKAMDTDPKNDIKFIVNEVSHHKERPMIIAKLSAGAVDTVCQSKDTDLIISLRT